MRKKFKKKKRSCGLCKPHKVGWSNRWTAKDLGFLREFEKEKLNLP